MKYAKEMRESAMMAKKEKDARSAEIATKYINDVIMPDIKQCALDGRFALNHELHVVGITNLDAIKLQLGKHGYHTEDCGQYLAIEW